MRSALILGLVAVAGCASSPGYRSSTLQVPETFREASDTMNGRPRVTVVSNRDTARLGDYSIARDDWEQLGDSTLNRLIAEAVRANQDIQAAEARVRASSAERSRAVLDLTPDTRLAGSYNRQRLSGASIPGFAGSFPDQTLWETALTASWDLDIFGQLRQTVRAQGARVGVAAASLRDVQVSLAAELARTYFALRGAQEQLGVARENADNQRRTFNIARQRLEAGRGSSFDTERAQAQLSSTLASIPAHQAQVAAAQYRIGVLVGRPPAAVARELDDAGRIPALPDVASVGNPEAVVRARPDVAAAEREAAAQGALVGAAKASYLPKVSIGGSAGYVASEFRAVGDQGTLRYAVASVISWPLLSLGRVKAEVDAAQAHEDAARSRYRAVVLSAMEELEVSISRYRAARERVDRLEEASAASRHAAELALLRFTEGATDLLQVLDAQRTQLDAQDRLAQARIDAGTAYAALFKAIGGR